MAQLFTVCFRWGFLFVSLSVAGTALTLCMDMDGEALRLAAFETPVGKIEYAGDSGALTGGRGPFPGPMWRANCPYPEQKP